MSDSDKCPELKPCPFCGSSGRLDYLEWDGHKIWGIHCNGCKAQMLMVPSQEKLITAWNTRLSALRSAVEKLRDRFASHKNWRGEDVAELITAVLSEGERT